MARVVDADRFGRLIEVATQTFVARGYRQTQMADVAEALGVAKGTLYGYVESKEALFDAAVRFADGQGSVPKPADLPFRTPGEGATVEFIRERLSLEAQQLMLVSVLTARKPAHPSEFADILRDLYRRMLRNRKALKLVDRCAIDHPELASVWFKEGRWAQVELVAAYLERRIAEGNLREPPSVPLAARMILETLAFWSIHMPWDPSPQGTREVGAEDAVVDLLVHAYTAPAAGVAKRGRR